MEDGAIIDRKLNVAITRARKQMIMTGNPEILRNNQIFSELIEYVRGKGGYVVEPSVAIRFAASLSWATMKFGDSRMLVTP